MYKKPRFKVLHDARLTPVNEMGKCPKGGKYLEYGDSYPENEEYCYEWSCPTCNISGKEWYKMTFIEHTIN